MRQMNRQTQGLAWLALLLTQMTALDWKDIHLPT
jgi:hypothetical protein